MLTIRQACLNYASASGDVVRILALPIALLWIVGWYERSLSWLLLVVLIPPVSVACHRLFLLGPRAIRWYSGLLWDKRVLWFFLLEVGLLIGLGAMKMVFGWARNTALGPVEGYVPIGLIALMSLVPFWYLFARYSLVFPATAVDDPTDFNTSWDQTSGEGWRLAAVSLLPPWLVTLVLDALLTPLDLWLLGPLETMLSLSFGIACLCAGFRVVAKWRPPSTATS